MSNKNIIRKEISLAGKKLILETGELAVMSNMAVKASYGDTVVLVTVISGGYNPDLDFFPLMVNYQEKFYASGSIKSSRFQKRDGRSTDDAIITQRSIDHAIRPLFPSDFMDEVQIVATVLSLDPECDPKFTTMIATSAALHASNIPWDGPMVSGRVAYLDDDYSLFPSREQLNEKSDLDMIVSFVGDDRRFLAIEAEANILPEEKILGAIEHARNNLDELYDLIVDFAMEVNPEGKKYVYESRKLPQDLMDAVSKVALKKIEELMGSDKEKDHLTEQFDLLLEEIYVTSEGKFKKADMVLAYEEIKKKTMQSLILKTKKRPDGRKVDEIRPLSSKIGVLPRTHGSALFNRGLTQVLTIATLASPSQELLIQDMYGERSKKYLHYYIFPPYASGEVGKVGWPKNREIGHGMIAENALRPVVPDQTEFPYMIMLVSETMSSSGSTSMASTCGSTLALMDAGVPISDMVAGIGVGLIANEDFSNYLIMTDLAYMEDAFGLLDFKMTGTKTGVTAIQCDMKVPGLPMELVPQIIERSKEARLKVLAEMEKTINTPKETVSQYAPKTVSLKIDPDKIGVVIGSGGKTIKEIQAKTGAEISIEEDGTVVISSVNIENSEKAAEYVRGLTKEVERGEIYEGVVEEVVDFGAFVEILPGKTGLLHISELSTEYVTDINSFIKAGDAVRVIVKDTTPDGKISLSVRMLDPSYVEKDDENRGRRSGFNDNKSRGGGPRSGSRGGSRGGPRGNSRGGQRRPNNRRN